MAIRNKAHREEFLAKIAKRLRQLRIERNLTQEQVYMDTHIHIGKIETNTPNILMATLENICTYYGITLSEFFDESFNQ